MHVSWRKCIRFHPPVFPAVIAEGEIFPVKATGAQFVQEKMGLRSNKAETSNFINQGVVLLWKTVWQRNTVAAGLSIILLH